MNIYDTALMIETFERKKTRVIDGLYANHIYFDNMPKNEIYIIVIRSGYLTDYTEGYVTLHNDYGTFKSTRIENVFLVEANKSVIPSLSNETVIKLSVTNINEFLSAFYDANTVKEMVNKKVLKDAEKWTTSILEIEKEKKEKQLVGLKHEKKRTVEMLFEISRKIDRLCAEFNFDKVIEEIKRKTMNELAFIMQHKLVDSVEFSDGYLIINTKSLHIREPHTNRRYYLGKMSITIYMSNGNLNIDCVNNDRYSDCWGSNVVHPHVNQEGEPCLGTAAEQFSVFWSEKEYYAAFITILNYLQTVDIEDIAGYEVCQWDEVGDDGEIICEGHSPRINEYEGSGCSDGRVYCAECEGRFDESDGMYVGENFYCRDCFDDLFNICTECGNIVHIDDVFLIDGDYYCETCYNKLTETEEENV